MIDWAQGDLTRPNNILIINSIEDALISTTPSRLEAVLLDENEEINFVQYQKQRRYKLCIIGDNTGTSPVLIYDELIENIQIGETFLLTQIKSKKIHNKMILITTGNTIITKIDKVCIKLKNTFMYSLN